MRATGWHNGGSLTDPGGYGIRFSATDRDKYFLRDWVQVVLELEGGEPAPVSVSPSFWRTCGELRSAAIGEWLLDTGVAPWRRGAPPGIVVSHLDDNRFAVRILKRHVLL